MTRCTDRNTAGACVAASAEGGKRNDYKYEHEPKSKECRLSKPWRYKCAVMATYTHTLHLQLDQDNP